MQARRFRAWRQSLSAFRQNPQTPSYQLSITFKEADMAWYTSHQIRFRGRLVKVGSRYGAYFSAVVEKGKPLDLSDEYSRDVRRLRKLFGRNRGIQRDIQEFVEAMDSHYS